MSVLRSKFVILVISLLVLGGYSHELLGACDHRDQQQERQAPGHDKQPSTETKQNCCPCLCHQVFGNLSSIPVRIAPSELLVIGRHVVRGEYPPDVEPRGIDYPPQLA